MKKMTLSKCSLPIMREELKYYRCMSGYTNVRKDLTADIYKCESRTAVDKCMAHAELAWIMLIDKDPSKIPEALKHLKKAKL